MIYFVDLFEAQWLKKILSSLALAMNPGAVHVAAHVALVAQELRECMLHVAPVAQELRERILPVAQESRERMLHVAQESRERTLPFHQ